MAGSRHSFVARWHRLHKRSCLELVARDAILVPSVAWEIIGPIPFQGRHDAGPRDVGM